MQSEVKATAIDTRKIALDMLVLMGRAVATGVAVSVAAAVLIVGMVTLVS